MYKGLVKRFQNLKSDHNILNFGDKALITIWEILVVDYCKSKVGTKKYDSRPPPTSIPMKTPKHLHATTTGYILQLELST